MRILICVSGNAPNFRFEYNQVFVYEQMESIRRLNPSVDYRVFAVEGKGIRGYLSSLKILKRAIKEYKPDIIHAHCGQIGALTVLQRSVPVITTFHGSDINNRKMRPISSFASMMSSCSIFVSSKLKSTLRIKGKDCIVIPCAVDRDIFYPMDKDDCKRKLGLNPDRDYILFASDFNNSVKNPALAQAVTSHFPQVDLLEIKGRSREEVAWLINGAELVLMTSHSEGSPQIIKEAIACGQQIVTVDVGDVREQLDGIPGCRICPHDESELVEAVRDVLESERVFYKASDRFNSKIIAQTILNKYILISSKMENYRICSRCVMDNDHDTHIRFDAEGHCNYCNTALENKELIYFPGEKGKEKIKELVSQLKKEGEGKKYDCMMGISGGLDSSYLAMLGFKWGLRILGVHVDDGFDEPIATQNIKNLCQACNIDLVTITPDAEQYNDLTRAFILAEVPNIAMPQDNILFACLYDYARKYHIKTFLSGGNFALESILKHTETANVYDMRNMLDIHRKFGTKPIDKLPFLSNFRRVADRYLRGINSKRPLNYIDYNRDRAIQELNDFCGFQYYEMKHCENKLTKVIQLYWLPLKFHNDKRRSHLSSMIISGQMTRDEALNELHKPLYNEETMNRDIDIVLKQVGLERDVFDTIVNRPGKKHADYKTSTSYRIVANLFKKSLIRFKG